MPSRPKGRRKATGKPKKRTYRAKQAEPRWHVWIERCQPATNFRDPFIGNRIRWPARRLFACDDCGERHQARNMVVQVYYDCIKVFCAKGKGCHTEGIP